MKSTKEMTGSMGRLLALAAGVLLAGRPARAALASEPATAADAAACAQKARDQAEAYRAMGGTGYKTGLVQRAEADAVRYDAMAAPVAVVPASPQADHYAKLGAQYRAMGGTAYKTGLVQSAEAQQRRYEPATATAATQWQWNDGCDFVTKPAVDVLACTP